MGNPEPVNPLQGATVIQPAPGDVLVFVYRDQAPLGAMDYLHQMFPGQTVYIADGIGTVLCVPGVAPVQPGPCTSAYESKFVTQIVRCDLLEGHAGHHEAHTPHYVRWGAEHQHPQE